jgi:hypothetical protein
MASSLYNQKVRYIKGLIVEATLLDPHEEEHSDEEEINEHVPLLDGGGKEFVHARKEVEPQVVLGEDDVGVEPVEGQEGECGLLDLHVLFVEGEDQPSGIVPSLEADIAS